MKTALLRYVVRAVVTTQRYAAPVVLLVLVTGAVLAAPPLDSTSALFVAIAVFACSAWSVYLALGCEGPAQEAITRTRCGSRRALRTAKILVGAGSALAVPVVGIALAALSRHLAQGTPLLWLVALLAPAVTGAGLGALVHALLRARPGHATLAVLAVTTLDLIGGWAPPLGLLAGPASTAHLVLDAAGSVILGGAGVLVADRLDARR